MIKIAYLRRHESEPNDLAVSLASGHRLLLDTTWELARADRIERAKFAGLLREAERGQFRAPGKWRTEAYGLTEDAEATRWALIFREPQRRADTSLDTVLRCRWFHAEELSRLRGLRIVVAAARHHADTGHALPSLNGLVPQYFAELPASPYRDQRFVYRRAEKEAPHPNQDRGGISITPQVGQGMIWDTAYPERVFLVPVQPK